MTVSLLREDTGALCTLTLNRPDKRNALDTVIFQQLDSELADLETCPDTIGCVIVRANGPAFCGGADLNDGGRVPRSYKPQVIERLSRLPQIVIAQVHALCVTGGLELALAADIIVASHAAQFGDTHGRWGLVAGWGMSQRLPRRIGISQAKLLMMSGRIISAQEAHRIGLVDVLVNDNELDGAVVDLAHDILANSRHTNRETKTMLAETEGLSLSQGLAHELYRHPGSAPDTEERIKRFLTKD